MLTGTVLTSLTLANFRNLKATSLSFSEGIQLIGGPNGAGKTNLLDAIYYLCVGRSHFSYGDRSAVVHGDNWLRLVGDFKLDLTRESIVLTIRPRKGKVLERNGVPYTSIVEHVGLLPAVMISPADIDLVIGGPEERRRFLDQSISQFDPQYLKALLTFNKVLKLRNALLKDAATPQEVDGQLLATYDHQLLSPARVIFEARTSFVERLLPVCKELYRAICGGVEEPSLSFESKLAQQRYADLLLQNRDRDLYLKRTTSGPHRDDLVLLLNGEAVRKFASQGQLKTFVLALRLAQARLLRELQGKAPILLLDDVFDRLDPIRVQQLVDLVRTEAYSQIFISDSQPKRLTRLRVEGMASRLYEVSAGKIIPSETS